MKTKVMDKKEKDWKDRFAKREAIMNSLVIKELFKLTT